MTILQHETNTTGRSTRRVRVMEPAGIEPTASYVRKRLAA